jgi:hypothetical protein
MTDEEVALILGEYVNELLNRVDGLERILNTSQLRYGSTYRFLDWRPILDDVMKENPVVENDRLRSERLQAALNGVEDAHTLMQVLAKNFGRIPPK